MPLTSFETLPDDARLWVFGAERSLAPDERSALLSAVDGFLAGWRAHGAPLTAARDLREERFLLVGVDQRSVPPSGCSIDALVGVLERLEGTLGVALVGHGAVFFRGAAGEVSRANRAQFRALAQAGEVGPDTTVFDTAATRVGEVRTGAWERPAGAGWHGRAFFGTKP